MDLLFYHRERIRKVELRPVPGDAAMEEIFEIIVQG
jgi:hypothetical protein